MALKHCEPDKNYGAYPLENAYSFHDFLNHEPGFPGGLDGKEFARNAGDPGFIPRLGRSPWEEMRTHSRILAWKNQRIEELGGLQSMWLQSRIGLSNFHIHTYVNYEPQEVGWPHSFLGN